MKVSIFFLFILLHGIGLCQKKSNDRKLMLSQEKIIEAIYKNKDIDTSYTEIIPFNHYKLVILANDVVNSWITFYPNGQFINYKGDSIAFLFIGMIYSYKIELYLEIWKIKFKQNKTELCINLVNETPTSKRIIRSKKIFVK